METTQSSTTKPTRPLAGLRVVELSSYVATPLCGLTLRQLGADVIRVEPMGGAADRTRLPRSNDGTSLYWSGLNQGKRALAVDMTRTEGRDLVRDLICEPTRGKGDRQAGAIVVTNSSRYEDLTYAGLVERRPDLIYGLLTGRRDGQSAVDYTVQASTGFPELTGPVDSRAPTNSVVPAWDIAAGLYLATGLAAAARARDTSGEGAYLEVALEDVAFSTAGALGYLAEAQMGTMRRGPSGNDVFGTFGRDFVCSDGTRFMVVVLTNRQWNRLLEGTGLSEVVQAVEVALDASLADEAGRYRHRDVISSLLQQWFSQHSADEVRAVLRRCKCPHSSYRTFQDLAAQDAAALREHPLFGELTQPGVGTYLAPGAPVRLGATQVPATAAPAVGAHSEEILLGLGLDTARITALRADGIVG